MWDESNADDGPEVVEPKEPQQYVDIDTLDDGRCTVSSWRVKRPEKTTYENLFGPGGYNRCTGSPGHANPMHRDEWGHVFKINDDGTGFKVVRHEPLNPNPPEVMI